MADSYYQIATTPKLYVSYPLYQYASGGLDTYYTEKGSFSDEDMIKLLQIDPSTQVTFPTGVYNFEYLYYKIVPSFDDSNPVESSLWNFDFYMILGHNFASQDSGHGVNIKAYRDDTAVANLDTSNIVNYCSNDTVCEYNGWSLGQINDIPDDANTLAFHFTPNSTGDTFDNIKIGSLLFGKSFEFPQNTTLATSTKFEYGIKQKSTISGKTISQANWTKPDNWISEPFGLGFEQGDNFQRRSGRRSWKMSFDYLAPDKVMNQNMMMNSNGFTAQDNHSTAADGVESLYNINNSTDFYTNVIHRCMNNHLPMVLQLDKNNNSPDQFAIVRIKNKSYQVKQKSPNLYSISVEFIEQI